ncbi:MAG: Nif3-like dinuclear metal center hexameric protein [Actinobacteria bacterium]|nr:Nif3-like dinuclear metal center hexameric protein [Actinomycetota bacterium]
MAHRDEILAHAAELLDLDSFPDYGPMGMQVAGSPSVTRIACGVSASRELFERAAASGAQLLLVHHGLLWNSDPRTIDTRLRRRLEALFAAGMTLAAYHLALDAHPEIGNNALLCQTLGVRNESPFAKIGFGGCIEPASLETFTGLVSDRLGREPLVFPYGPEVVERVAVVTGGAGRYVVEAAEEGYDLFLTGEAEEPTLHIARELGIHFVAGGHYATETLGVQALAGRLAKRFGVPWEFIDLPNPV